MVQDEPMKPVFNPPGTKRLTLRCDTLLSSFAFKINFRRYNVAPEPEEEEEVDPTRRRGPEPIM